MSYYIACMFSIYIVSIKNSTYLEFFESFTFPITLTYLCAGCFVPWLVEKSTRKCDPIKTCACYHIKSLGSNCNKSILNTRKSYSGQFIEPKEIIGLLTDWVIFKTNWKYSDNIVSFVASESKLLGLCFKQY